MTVKIALAPELAHLNVLFCPTNSPKLTTIKDQENQHIFPVEKNQNHPWPIQSNTIQYNSSPTYSTFAKLIMAS